jgi:hypothetical protein
MLFNCHIRAEKYFHSVEEKTHSKICLQRLGFQRITAQRTQVYLTLRAEDLSMTPWFISYKYLTGWLDLSSFMSLLCMYMHGGARYGVTNYKNTKAKCRHVKNWPVKGLCGRCFFEVYRLEIQSQSCWYFQSSFVNCFPSNLLSGSTSPPPLPVCPVWISILQCEKWGGGVLGSGPQTDKHLPQSPFMGSIV